MLPFLWLIMLFYGVHHPRHNHNKTSIFLQTRFKTAFSNKPVLQNLYIAKINCDHEWKWTIEEGLNY